jgi:hypothetical protein
VLKHLHEVAGKRTEVGLDDAAASVLLEKGLFLFQKLLFEDFPAVYFEQKQSLLFVDGDDLVVLAEGSAGEPESLFEVDEFNEQVIEILYSIIFI